MHCFNSKTLIVLLLFIFSFTLKDYAQGVKGEIIENDPYFSTLIIQAGGYLDTDTKDNTTVGLTGMIDFYPKKFTSVNLAINTGLIGDKTDAFIQGPYITSNRFKQFLLLEAGTHFYLFNKVHEGSGELTLGFGRRTRYVTHVPIQVRKILALRTGLHYEARSITNYDAAGVLKASDGTSFGALGTAPYNGNIFTSMTIPSVYVGIGYMNFKRVVAELQGYGIRRNTTITNFYLDGIIAVTGKVDDLIIGENKFDVQNGEGFDFKKLGFRGGAKVNYGKRFGYYMKLELGRRPTYTTSPWYVMAGLGFNTGIKTIK